MRIKHAIPCHGCFLIVQPARGDYRKRCFLVNSEKGEVYELEDPETGEISKAILLDYYTYAVSKIPDSICYLAYGMGSKVIVPALQERFPVLRDNHEVEVLILKRID